MESIIKFTLIKLYKEEKISLKDDKEGQNKI